MYQSHQLTVLQRIVTVTIPPARPTDYNTLNTASWNEIAL